MESPTIPGIHRRKSAPELISSDVRQMKLPGNGFSLPEFESTDVIANDSDEQQPALNNSPEMNRISIKEEVPLKRKSQSLYEHSPPYGFLNQHQHQDIRQSPHNSPFSSFQQGNGTFHDDSDLDVLFNNLNSTNRTQYDHHLNNEQHNETEESALSPVGNSNEELHFLHSHLNDFRTLTGTQTFPILPHFDHFQHQTSPTTMPPFYPIGAFPQMETNMTAIFPTTIPDMTGINGYYSQPTKGPNFPYERRHSEKRRRSRVPSSVYRGVSRCGKDNKFQARIRIQGKVKYLGRFKNEVEAARCYDKHAVEFLGAQAQTNFPVSSQYSESQSQLV